MQDLPLPMKATVDNLRDSNRESLEIKDNIIVNFNQESDGYYRLELQLLDGLEKRFLLSLRLPDEATCKKMAKNWKANSFAIYNDILARLSNEAESADCNETLSAD